MNYLALKRRRDFGRRRWQIAAVAATVFLGVLMYAASYDAYQNLDASYRGTYERLRFADMTVTGASRSFPAEAAALDGVSEVESRQQADVPLKVGGTELVGRVVGMPGGQQPMVNRIDLVEGEYLSGALDEVLVEVHMAEHFGLEVGDTFEVATRGGFRDVMVVGIAVSPEYIWPARSSQEILVGPDDFGVLFGSERLLYELPRAYVVDQDLVLYDADADAQTLDGKIRGVARLESATAIVARKDQPSNKTIQLDVLGFKQMAYAFPVMFLLAAGLATYTLLTRLVHTERPMIGTLRANGLSKRAVVRHYLSYGVWIGGISALLGVLLGAPLGWATTAVYTSELGIPDTIRSFYPLTPVIGVLFGVVTGALSAWVPARAAASVAPAEAQRGDAPSSGGHRSVAETLLPPLQALPARWLMVLRGIGRNPRRSFSTALGVVLALVLVLASWGLLDTIEELVRDQFERVQLEDVSVAFTRPVTDDVVAEVADVRGVDTAERVAALEVSIESPSDIYSTVLYGFDRDTAMHSFPTGPPPTDGVLLGRALRDELDVEEGDDIVLKLRGLDATVHSHVAGFADESLGSLAYMDRASLAKALEHAEPPTGAVRLIEPDSSVVLARFSKGTDRSTAITGIEDLPAVAAVTDSRSLYRLTIDYMGLFYVFVVVMLVFGGLMAFALIFSTMSVNLAERVSELAAMRANGMSRQELARLVVGENMLLTAIAIPPGLLLGYLASSALLDSYSSDLFSLEPNVRPSTYVLCALAMFAVTALSLWPGLRAAARIDIGTVVREHSQ